MAGASDRGAKVNVRPVSVVDGVYDTIYERLMALEIAPGARILIDTLARDLNVSQTPVREALSRLEREGLVRKAHLIGYSAAPQLSRKQFEDLYKVRELLEPEAARLAALNMTPEGLAAIEGAAADMGRGDPPVDRNSRYSRFARADAQFHDAIMRVSGNDVIRSTLFNLHVHLHIFRLMFHTRVAEEALEEHARLLDALRDADSVAAEREMRHHIRRSFERILWAFD
jgi:DNA-binding GntR family transcriptional regulator